MHLGSLFEGQPLSPVSFARTFLAALLTNFLLFSSMLFTQVVTPDGTAIPVVATIVLFLLIKDSLSALLCALLSNALLSVYFGFLFQPSPKGHWRMDSIMLEHVIIPPFQITQNGIAFIPTIILLTALTGVLCAALKQKASHFQKLGCALLVGYVVVNFSLHFLSLNPPELSVDRGQPLQFDGQGYLRVFTTMRGGNDYYQAYNQVFKLDKDPQAIKRRFPTIFVFWQCLSLGSTSLPWLYVVGSGLALICSCIVMWKVTGHWVSVLAPFFLAPYLMYFAFGYGYTYVEIWGLFFVLYGLTFYLYGRFVPYLVWLTLAILTREFFLVYGCISVFRDFLFRKKTRWLSLLPFILFAGLYRYHLVAVAASVGDAQAAQVGGFLHGIKLDYLVLGLDFASLFQAGRAPVVWILCSLGLFGILRLRNREVKTYLLLSIAAFVTVFTLYFIPIHGVYGHYWSASFVPLLLVFAPAGLYPLFKVSPGSKMT